MAFNGFDESMFYETCICLFIACEHVMVSLDPTGPFAKANAKHGI